MGERLKNMLLPGKRQTIKRLMLAAKIAVGSSIAIYVAELLELQFSASAGIVTLLTLVTTKRGTIKLALARFATFAVVVLFSWMTFLPFRSEWLAFGIFIFLTVLMCQMSDWMATLSVNAVIGTHFLTTLDFSPSFFLNEFLLVFIGSTIAFVLNLFHHNRSQEEHLREKMSYTEEQMQFIFGEVAAYLSNKVMEVDVWGHVSRLEGAIREYIREAYEYQDNSFRSDPEYYIDYFEMRMDQCKALYNLHSGMWWLRIVPEQAKPLAEYMLYLAEHVTELNVPEPQLERLEKMLEELGGEPLPEDREELEGRAILYHIMKSIEDFLQVKKRFVDARLPSENKTADQAVTKEEAAGLRETEAAGTEAETAELKKAGTEPEAESTEVGTEEEWKAGQ